MLMTALLLLWLPVLAGAQHSGVCPNQLNENLYVDAQSTCERQCHTDQDCADQEKCCTNVCGLMSCVMSRFADYSLAEGKSALVSSSCEELQCSQQGAVCEVWEGQAVCKCQDGCGSEPSFTCASDGLTYFNRCYMDSEACARGVTLTVVACRFHLPDTSATPVPQETPPPHATTHKYSFPPVLYSSPRHKLIYQGKTVSFNCDVIGQPKPDVTWEKQSEKERVIMRPDQMYGNVVITNIGELVVYNAQTWDSGIYTCIARNAAGVLRADYPLSVVGQGDEDFDEETVPGSSTRPPVDCLAPVVRDECGEMRMDWYYDATLGSCRTFTHGSCPGSRDHFETYLECWVWCGREGTGLCALPAVQGPCERWEPRWAYNSLTKRCQAFVYGGCDGNENSFPSRSVCEAHCPGPGTRPCRSCRPRGKMLPSLCRSDFVVVGRLTELIEELDSGIARFQLEQVLRDEKMGLRLFRTQNLEVTLSQMDWSCPCPNLTQHKELPLLVTGEVREGTAVVLPHSYVRPVSERRIRKIQEILESKTCEMLQRFQD